MRVSLVVTVKNEAASIARLLDDARAQTRRPDEWIVVDGGSEDGTLEVLERAEGEGGLRVLRHVGNIASGRNRGAAEATGEIVAMTDAGCDLAPDWLESLVQQFDTPEFDLVGGATRVRLGRPFDLVQWSLLDQLSFRAERRRSPRFSCRSLAFRRTLWEQCAFPEWLAYGEGAWTIDQWQQLGARVVLVQEPPVRWEMRPDLRSFWLQHVRHMSGDGVARMRRLSNSLRLGFYTALVVSVVGAVALRSPAWLALPIAAWTAYLALNAGRLIQVAWREHRLAWLVPGLLWLPLLLAGLDSAKIVGFLSGLLAPGAQRNGQSAA